jgi:hypothetical protein
VRAAGGVPTAEYASPTAVQIAKEGNMMLKKLILGTGLLTSLGLATPALACDDDVPPAATTTTVYGSAGYAPVYYGNGYDYDRRYYEPRYGRDYWAWRRHEEWERRRAWHRWHRW